MNCSLTILPYDLRAVSGIAVQIDQGFLPLLRRICFVCLIMLCERANTRMHRAECCVSFSFALVVVQSSPA